MDQQLDALRATVIVRHPVTKELHVNFDAGLLQLLREARGLERLGIDLPQKVSDVLQVESRLKTTFGQVSSLLNAYKAAHDAVPVKAHALLQPLIDAVHHELRPALLSLTWTSLGVEEWLPRARAALQELLDRSKAVGDSIENRLDAVLRSMKKVVLVNLPRDASFTLDEFVRLQQDSVKKATAELRASSEAVRAGVEDVIDLALGDAMASRVHALEISRLNDGSGSASVSPRTATDPMVNHLADAADELRFIYGERVYAALLACLRKSLQQLKRRVCARSSDSFLFMEKPFFLLEVKLQLPRVRVVPALEDVQRATNKAALAVIQAFRRVPEWGAIGGKSPIRRKASLRDATAARHSAARRVAAARRASLAAGAGSHAAGVADSMP